MTSNGSTLGTDAASKSLDERAIRKAIRARLPVEAFKRRPRRAALIVLLAVAAVALNVALAAAPRIDLLAFSWVLLLGHVYAQLGFLGHEVLHGSMVASRRLQLTLGYVAFSPLLASPTLWVVCHNQMHHANPNHKDGVGDPDAYAMVAEYERVSFVRLISRLLPGSGHPVSYLYLFYGLTLYAQLMLWVQSRYGQRRHWARLDRRRAIAETLSLVAGWLAYAIWLGPSRAFFVVAIPMMICNFVLMSYIMTNHFLRPLVGPNVQILSGTSVRTSRWLDLLHFNFSYHVEHHLFPGLSPRHAPLVSAELERILGGERYHRPSHWRALVALYRTPSFYGDAETLVDPATRRTMKLEEVDRLLR